MIKYHIIHLSSGLNKWCFSIINRSLARKQETMQSSVVRMEPTGCPLLRIKIWSTNLSAFYHLVHTNPPNKLTSSQCLLQSLKDTDRLGHQRPTNPLAELYKFYHYWYTSIFPTSVAHHPSWFCEIVFLSSILRTVISHSSTSNHSPTICPSPAEVLI